MRRSSPSACAVEPLPFPVVAARYRDFLHAQPTLDEKRRYRVALDRHGPEVIRDRLTKVLRGPRPAAGVSVLRERYDVECRVVSGTHRADA